MDWFMWHLAGAGALVTTNDKCGDGTIYGNGQGDSLYAWWHFELITCRGYFGKGNGRGYAY